ncbi:MAG TPA: hypothetical protein VNK23_07995 [Candidatus Dormibacteraeota bacterium]|nr:hypothetical protein [Candidatus Dormibacteraeota bacterium]
MPRSSNAVASRQLAYAGLAALVLILVAVDCNATELQQATIAAFEHYVKVAQEQFSSTLKADGPFLWVDSQPKPIRARLYRELRSGKFIVQNLQTYDDGRPIVIPDGMVHHWIGIAFVPGSTLKDAEAVLQDYADYSRIYAPQVRRSKILSRDGDDFRLYLQLYRGSPREVSYNAYYKVHRQWLCPTRITSDSVSTRIEQLKNPSEPDSADLPAGQDSGYLWRMDDFWRYEQKDGGVYMQVETISLSRDVPGLLWWLAKPIIHHIAQQTVAGLLEADRRAIENPQEYAPNAFGQSIDASADPVSPPAR